MGLEHKQYKWRRLSLYIHQGYSFTIGLVYSNVGMQLGSNRRLTLYLPKRTFSLEYNPQ